MSIQAIFNKECIDKLTLITPLLDKAEQFEKNQMICRILKDCGNSGIAINDMSENQLIEFQKGLIETFKNFNWI